ncbi:hypothetical protein [Methanogenium cariaci]|uniref:Gp37-like protein n=1 Tax=Methanogenium cariaci TaxID=2197 RepID=UPI0007866FC5|nr:hypothetical protein [Methanogenium cariaci]
MLESCALQSGLGWSVDYDFDAGGFTFDAQVGTDRTTSILLSPPRLGNCLIAGYRACLSDAPPTTAIVAGQGEEAARTIQTVGTATGWGRREEYVDARDCATTDELTARGGEEVLAEKEEITLLEVEYISTPMYRYRTDFDIGDIISVEYPGGVCSMQARIVSVTETYPDGTIVLGLGKEWPDLISLLRKANKTQERT